jgi:hypothetical protein
MQDFRVASKTSGISSLSTSWQDLEAWYKSSNEVSIPPRSPRTKHENMENSKDLVRPNLVEQGASSKPKRNWRQGRTCSWGNTLEDSGSNPGQRRPQARPKSTQPTSRPSRPPFYLAAIQAIYSPRGQAPRTISFAICRRGAKKIGTPSRRGDNRASWLGSS